MAGMTSNCCYLFHRQNPLQISSIKTAHTNGLVPEATYRISGQDWRLWRPLPPRAAEGGCTPVALGQGVTVRFAGWEVVSYANHSWSPDVGSTTNLMTRVRPVVTV